MVGLSTTQLWAYNVPDALRITADLGFTSAEVWAEQVWMHGDSEQEIKQVAQSLGLALTVHAASWDLNLTSRNTAIRQVSLEQVIRSIDLAATIGAHVTTVHPGRATLHQKDLAFHWDHQVKAFRTLAKAGADRGVLISVELMEPIKKELVTEPEELNRLLHAVDHPNLGVTFDIAHIALDRDPVQMLKALARVDEVHISDSTVTKLHIPLGKGQIDFLPILHVINQLKIPLCLEGFESRREKDLAEWNLKEFVKLWSQVVDPTP